MTAPRAALQSTVFPTYSKICICRDVVISSYLDPAEAESLATVPLPGGVCVAVLAAPGDPHVVVRTAALGVVSVGHGLHVQR